jgi:hypothetical protein
VESAVVAAVACLSMVVREIGEQVVGDVRVANVVEHDVENAVVAAQAHNT